MAPSKARENILNKIRGALRKRIDMPFPQEEDVSIGFTGDKSDILSRFSTEFTTHKGKIIFCTGKEGLLQNLQLLIAEKKWKNISCQHPSLLEEIRLASLPLMDYANETEVAITGCECLVARTGSIVLSAADASGRTLPISAPVHLVIARANQLVFDINDAITHVQKKHNGNFPSALFFASGPSRTGDIERTLVIGVHGPVEVYLFLIK